MDLKTFVEETLCQLAEGIEAAQGRLAGRGVLINPPFVPGSGGSLIVNLDTLAGRDSYARYLQKIDFDIAVTASDAKQCGGRFSISVLSARIGADGKNENFNSSVSRIRFQVVARLPQCNVEGM